MTVTRNPSLIRESVALAGQLLMRWRRLPIVPLQSALLPTLLLITYHLMVSKSMARITGTNTLEVLVPTCAVAGAMFGAVGIGLAIPWERRLGLLSRYWTLPVHRASALTGRLLAEAARALIGSVIVTAVGIGLGLRFTNWLAIVPFVLIPSLVVAVFASLIFAIATRTDNPTPFAILGPLVVALVFGTAAVAPMKIIPAWLRPVVQYQPMSPVIEVMRSLEHGWPAGSTVLLAALWWLGLGVVLVPLAYQGYRIAVQR